MLLSRTGRKPEASTEKIIFRGIGKGSRYRHSTIEKLCPGMEMTERRRNG